MNRSTIFATLSVLGLACAVPSAPAAPFMNINFDADTPGELPVVGSPSVNHLSAIGGYAPAVASPPDAASGTILVGDAPGISKGIVMVTNPANTVTGALWADTAFNAVGQKLVVSFDINVLDAPTTATTQPKSLAGGGTAGILLGMNTFAGSDWAARFAVAPTSADGGIFAFRSADNATLHPFFNYEEGSTYNVEMRVDYTTGTVAAYVDGVQQMTGHAFWTAGKSDVVTQEFFFHLNGEGYASSVALDNITASIVPEPSSLLLATMGLGTVVRCRRRKRMPTRM